MKIDIRELSSAFVLLLGVTALIGGIFDLKDSFSINPVVTATILASVVVGVNSFLFWKYLYNQKITKTVGIIGFPQSGKTTLLFTLFNQILNARIANYTARIEGSTSIERVSEGINKIRKFQKIAPTTDQDVFAYRTQILKSQTFIKKHFKVEFGDFPGENTEEFVNNYGQWLHRTPYFRWVKDADSFVFVIDLGKYLIDRIDGKNYYVSDITTSFQAAWQHIVESNFDIKNWGKNKPILLILNKADLITMYNFTRKIKLMIVQDKIVQFDELCKNFIRIYAQEKIPSSQSNIQDEFVYLVSINFDISVKLVRENLEIISKNKGIMESIIIQESDIIDDFDDIVSYFNNNLTKFSYLFLNSYNASVSILKDKFGFFVKAILS
ncbi:MAG TPA: GTPase domain-containing protein [Saprospiraceae bacterium]|nr:GTPase domain-containing protein [Saprospiraceae bacterium]